MSYIPFVFCPFKNKLVLNVLKISNPNIIDLHILENTIIVKYISNKDTLYLSIKSKHTSVNSIISLILSNPLPKKNSIKLYEQHIFIIQLMLCFEYESFMFLDLKVATKMNKKLLNLTSNFTMKPITQHDLIMKIDIKQIYDTYMYFYKETIQW